MAEFPDLGQQCFECKTLDFLPLVCHFCKSIFCKAHHSVVGHNCPKYSEPIEKPSNSCKSESILGKCSFCKKSVPDIELVLCEKCNAKHCLPHRHEASHECPETNSNTGVTQPTKPVFTSSAPNIRGAKNEALSRKVALMRLKQTAKGDNGLPSTERLYFNISFQRHSQQNLFESKALFVSKEWSVGKCVDWLATHLGLTNNNNNPLCPKLVLCLNDDNCETLSFSSTLKDLEINDMIHSGDKLVLKYIIQ